MSYMRVAAIIAAVIVALGAVELYRSNRILDIQRITVSLSGLPASFEGYKIAHLSDLHGAQFGSDNELIADILRGERPDIIVITGDYIDNRRDIDMVFGTAEKLCGIAPVYYVPGNHEYASKIAAQVFSELERAGIKVLRNQSVMLTRGEDSVSLLGIDDPNGPLDMISMTRAVELVRMKTEAPIIMLNHRYDRAEEIAELDVALALVGHAHGGLIRLPFTDGLVGPSYVLFPKYTNGLYQLGNLSLVSSRGIGNAGMTLRLFNKPHIPIITLASK